MANSLLGVTELSFLAMKVGEEFGYNANEVGYRSDGDLIRFLWTDVKKIGPMPVGWEAYARSYDTDLPCKSNDAQRDFDPMIRQMDSYAIEQLLRESLQRKPTTRWDVPLVGSP